MRTLPLLVVASFTAACPDRSARLNGTLATVTETFEQTKSGAALDLLFVVDNSRSMGPAQQQVAGNLGTFFEWVNRARVDYQIAVTSTDAVGVTGARPAARGQFSSRGGVAIVRPTTPNGMQVLASNIALGTDGTNREQPLFTALQALGLLKSQRGVPPAANLGFVRRDARLGIIFVTDEDDFSPIYSADALLALRDLKGLGNHDSVFLGAVVFDGFELNPEYRPLHPERLVARQCQTGQSDQRPGYGLIDLLAHAHHPSAIASICGDFAPMLRQMAIAAAGLQTRFKLAQQADPFLGLACDRSTASFCVRVDGAVIPAESYTYQAATNEIVFDKDFVPPVGSTLTVDFAVITKTARERDAELGEVSSCSTDVDCPAGIRCSAGRCVLHCSAAEHCRDGFACSAEGSCRCTSDASCNDGEVCTASGACQPRPPCTGSASCGAGQYCEPVTGACRPIGQCVRPAGLTNDFWADTLATLSCPQGSVCDGAACRPGCQTDQGCAGGETCRRAAGQAYGTCVRGCQSSEDCCLGQRCDAASGRCLQVAGVVDAGTVIPLCDAASCDSNRCTSAGGSCNAIFDTDFGCVPSCRDSADCAKGYSCAHPLIHTTANACRFGGPACAGGRRCSASAESPVGVCSCLTDAECGPSATCFDYGTAKYCRTTVGSCAPQYECSQLRTAEALVCNDTF